MTMTRIGFYDLYEGLGSCPVDQWESYELADLAFPSEVEEAMMSLHYWNV